jgi:GAF domain-containing protein
VTDGDRPGGVDLTDENAALRREVARLTDERTATSQVLGMIAASAGEVEPVFEAILANAMRLCQAEMGHVYRVDDEVVTPAATHGSPPEHQERLRVRGAWRPDPRTGVAEAIRLKKPVQLDDLGEHPLYAEGHEDVVAMVEDYGLKTLLHVPMLKASDVIGVIVLYRNEVRPFDRKHIDLVDDFAAQAVIAIENARLLSELRESLDRQTATSRVLGVIASSPGELERVFQTVAESAVRICEAERSFIFLYDGKELPMVASFNATRKLVEWVEENPLQTTRSTVSGRVFQAGHTIQIPDVQADPEYTHGAKDVEQYRTVLGVPILKGDFVLGVVTLYRLEIRPFSDKQIALVESFADQAAIAIENARLLEDLNARNRDLSEALERQTASAEVLRAIASSPSDLDAVLDTIAETAHRLFGAMSTAIMRLEGHVFRRAATIGQFAEDLSANLSNMAVDHESVSGRAVLDKQTIYIDDIQARSSDFPSRAAGDAGRQSNRSIVATPLLREGEAIGALAIAHGEVRAYSNKQIELLESFADQAVIAIENARLLDELRESLENQTASAEILRTIAAAPAQPEQALNTIAETTVRLFGATGATIRTVNGDRLRLVGSAGPAVPGLRAALGDETPITPDTLPGFTVLQKEGIHIPDIDNPDPGFAHWPGLEPLRAVGIRSEASMPLMREGQAIGVIIVQRHELKPFNDKELAQLANFADQAVIAIENARLLAEIRARLDHEAASREILQVISQSRDDEKPVFEIILRNASRLCKAPLAFLTLPTEDRTHVIVGAHLGARPAFAEVLDNFKEPIEASELIAVKPIAEGCVFRQDDIADDDLYRNRHPRRVAMVEDEGIRSILCVPLLKAGVGVGGLILYRREVAPFSDDDVVLAEGFAAQAVIAIENARVLSELHESLDRRTAMAEVLAVISSSPGDVQPVFEAMLDNAVRLCDATEGSVFSISDNLFRRVATHGSDADLMVYDEVRVLPATPPGRMLEMLQTVHVTDMSAMLAELPYPQDEPAMAAARALVERGVRNALWAPMVRENTVVGAFVLHSREAVPFSEAQIELVETFANQAVIAVENARLLNDLNARNRDLSESLEQQTATSDILRAIASAEGEADRVLDTIADTAHRLFGAYLCAITRIEDGVFRQAAVAGPEAATISGGLSGSPVDRQSISGRAATEMRTVHLDDLWENVDQLPNSPGVRGGVKTRSLAAAPLIRDGQAIGTIAISLSEVRPFTEKQLALLESFADQAVIAIENARLLSELRESLERRTATADVLAVISASPGDVQPVFETMLDKAVAICAASEGSVFTRSGKVFQRIASRGLTKEMTEHKEVRAAPGTPPGEMLRTRETIHTPDLQRAGEKDGEFPGMNVGRVVIERGGRSALWVPLIKDGEVVGAFVLIRRVVGPFSDNQIGLIENFASQAVIAIDNARLLEELRTARDAAERAVEELQEAQASLIHAEKMASLGQLTAGIAHEIKNPLNFVNNFASLSVELLDELKETAAPAIAALAHDERGDVDEVIDMLTGNLEKVAEHGKRADGIVKSMLAHSRGGGGERQSVDLNALVEESLNLAYHGARAQDQNFNITMERNYDPATAPLEVVPQDLTRVLLNLFSNGFYAANERASISGDPDFHPTLKVRTRDNGSNVEIRIRDNGTGIPADLKEKLFEPFFTTKPTGEGTGLGLSISYEIVTKQHGGTITVESEPGDFTEFCITLPRQAQP